MKNVLVAGAVALALSLPASALAQSQSDIDALKSQVDELNKKIEGLEAKDSKTSWAEKVALKADLRYRYEDIDEEGRDNRDRQRIRARIGIVGKPNDNTEIGFGIRTGGNDPRSGNVTLDGDSQSKDIALDLGYAKWSPTDYMTVTAGKMKQPWTSNAIDYFWDGDYNPEGLAANFTFAESFYAGVHWFQIDERSSEDDSSVVGGQVGYAGDLFYASVSYLDYLEMDGYNPCYEGNCNGNTVDGNGDLVYDYNIVLVQGGVKLAGFDIFGSWAQNSDPDDEDTAYAIGAKYGKAKDPGTWEVGAVYQDVEQDALYGGVIDSDFGSGETAHDGFAVKGAYALAKNWTVGLTYYNNSIDKTTDEKDYERWQLDFQWKL